MHDARTNRRSIADSPSHGALPHSPSRDEEARPGDERLRRLLLRRLRRMLVDVHRAESVVAETMVLVWQEFGDEVRSPEVRRWALRVARNLALNELRALRRDRLDLGDGVEATPQSTFASGEFACEVQWFVERLHARVGAAEQQTLALLQAGACGIGDLVAGRHVSRRAAAAGLARLRAAAWRLLGNDCRAVPFLAR